MGNKFLPSPSQAHIPPALHPSISKLSRQHFISPHRSHVSENKSQTESKKLLQSEGKTALHVPDGTSATLPWLGIPLWGAELHSPSHCRVTVILLEESFFPHIFTLSPSLWITGGMIQPKISPGAARSWNQKDLCHHIRDETFPLSHGIHPLLTAPLCGFDLRIQVSKKENFIGISFPSFRPTQQ